MGLSARTIIDGLPPERRQELDAFIVEWFPKEACGLVLETAEGQGKVELVPNLADKYHQLDPDMYPRTGEDAYVLNPMLIVKAERRGEKLVAIWHSHVRVGSYFSEEDIDQALIGDDGDGEARYPGVDYVVFDAQDDGVKGYRVFQHAGGRTFDERLD